MSETTLAVKQGDLDRLAERINDEHRHYVEAACSTLEHSRRAGELLIEAKGKVEHGGWLPWLQGHFEFSDRVARNYMRVAREWPVIEGNRQRAADLSVREAIRLLVDLSDVETAATPSIAADNDLPPALAIYLAEEAITLEHVRQLHTLKDAYGPDLVQRVVGQYELEYPVIAFDHEAKTLGPRRAEDVPPGKAADGLINLCRVEDNPITWFWRYPYSTECPAVVVCATEAFRTDLSRREFRVPQWEVGAFWWASQIVLAIDFGGFPGPDEWLAHHLVGWRERHEHALVWWRMQREEGRMKPDDMDDEEEKEMWGGFRSDLRHSSSVGRAELPLGTEGTPDREMELRIIRDICERGVIFPTAMQHDRVRRVLAERENAGVTH